MGNAFENIERLRTAPESNAVLGKVVYAPIKSWLLITAYALTVVGLIFFLRIDTVLLFLVKSAVVLLLGHSVGMHRRLIHKSFDCPLWLERFFVYMGVLTGLGGPFAMIRTHDFRDWAQRQPKCHDYFAHRQAPLIDAIWQMHCEVRLATPPELIIEREVAEDPFYRFIDRHWVLVHLPWIVVFFLIGGWGWVIWGVAAQVAVTATGHWLIGYMAHQPHGDKGPDHWRVETAGVQGRNVPLVGLITMGEGWHNNHHAFPGSARIGLYAGQSDPGYVFLKVLQAVGLVWNIRLPQHLSLRKGMRWVGLDESQKPEIEASPRPLLARLVAHLRN